MAEESGKVSIMDKCYRCGIELTDWELESNQDPLYGKLVKVCVNRRECRENAERFENQVQRYAHCPICEQRILFTRLTKKLEVKQHLTDHCHEDLVEALMESNPLLSVSTRSY